MRDNPPAPPLPRSPGPVGRPSSCDLRRRGDVDPIVEQTGQGLSLHQPSRDSVAGQRIEKTRRIPDQERTARGDRPRCGQEWSRAPDPPGEGGSGPERVGTFHRPPVALPYTASWPAEGTARAKDRDQHLTLTRGGGVDLDVAQQRDDDLVGSLARVHSQMPDERVPWASPRGPRGSGPTQPAGNRGSQAIRPDDDSRRQFAALRVELRTPRAKLEPQRGAPGYKRHARRGRRPRGQQ